MNALRDLRVLEHAFDVDDRTRAFGQYVACLAANNGRHVDTINDFAQRYPRSSYLDFVRKANPLSPNSPDTGASHLTLPTLSSAFVEFLRPATVLGQMAGARRVPFNARVTKGTAGVTALWVGVGEAKPVGEGAFETLELPLTKIAAIVVLTNELVRLSSDMAADRVAQDLAAAVGQAIDATFLSAAAAVATVSPAGILATATQRASTGTTGAQIEADILPLLAGITVPLKNPYWVMSPAATVKLATLRNKNGALVFPDMALVNGRLFGIPVIVSAGATVIALVDAAYVLLAEEPGVSLSVAAEASIDMTQPTSPVTASVADYSLFQRDAVAVRAERYISWVLAQSGAAAYISGASYV
jgi:HK97 family phage major capsid protein